MVVNRLCYLAVAAAFCLSTGTGFGSEVSPASSTSEAKIPLAREILSAAHQLVELRTPYKMTYPRIAYPGGDIAAREGLCCDVIIRALRAAGIDLQELVYEDYRGNMAPYLKARMNFQQGISKSWAHRRTALLDVFLQRHATSLANRYTPETADQWQPGDIVIFKRNGWETWHIALVSDATSQANGEPMLIDAWQEPGYVSDTHSLSSYGAVGGHYRIPESLRDKLPEAHCQRAREAWMSFVEKGQDTRLAGSRSRTAAGFSPRG